MLGCWAAFWVQVGPISRRGVGAQVGRRGCCRLDGGHAEYDANRNTDENQKIEVGFTSEMCVFWLIVCSNEDYR